VTRFLLVLALVALLLLLLAGMRWGWRNRLRRQAGLPALPPVPDAPGVPLLGPLTGEYVGTTFAGRWQDRVVHAGLGVPAQAEISLHEAGLLLRRAGAADVFVPRADLVGIRVAPGLAGRVVGHGGLLVLTWRLGGVELDSGLRADDKSAYPDWVDAVRKRGTARA
jgi:hypothetical protein